MKCVNKTSTHGFTIVEMLLYLGLLTILLVILTRIFTSILDVQLSSEATGYVEQDSRYIFSRLAYDIARADTIVSPATLGDSTNTLILTIGGIANTYSILNNNLTLTNDNGINVLNGYGTHVSSLTFLRLGNPSGKPSIQTSFMIASTVQTASGQETKTVTTTIATR